MTYDPTDHRGLPGWGPLPGERPARRQRQQPLGKMERRAHSRFPVRKGTFALIRSHPSRIGPIGSMSLGQIGLAMYAAKPCRVGPVIDISRGGIAFHASRSGPMATGTAVLDLLMAEKRLYLGGLCFQIIEDLKLPDDFIMAQPGKRLLRVRFLTPTARQRIKLDRFIHLSTTLADS
jgi:hypothetical protein